MASSTLWQLLLLINLCTSLTEDETQQQQAIDTFYDEDSETEWVILAGDVEDSSASQWEEDEKWDTIDENIETNKGHFVIRKCEKFFTSNLCLCQFVKLAGVSHSCHRDIAAEYPKQARLRQFAAHTSSRSAAASPLNNIFSRIQHHPMFNRVWSNQAATEQEQIIERKEQHLESELAAAQIAAENDELDEEEVEELEEEVEELEEEEEELEAEEEGVLEEELEEAQFDEEDDESDFDVESDGDDAYALDAEEGEYDEEMIEALDEEVESQNDLIAKQEKIIDTLKQDNAMKEELIEILEEETELDSELESDVYADDDDGYDDAYDGEYDDDNAETDEYFDDEDSEFVENNANEEYYDDLADEDSLMDEQYDELYDVDGEEDDTDAYDDSVYDDESETDEAIDIQKKESDAMIADTVWGFEVYAVAFGILICICVCCYLHQTKCCGYLSPSKREEFGYSAHAQQAGFKRVFGTVDDEDDDDDDDQNYRDAEMAQHDSDEAEMLHS